MMHIPSFVQYWLLGGELRDELAQLAYSGVLQTPIAILYIKKREVGTISQ